MIRITLKDFKKATAGMPDDAILCMYSDSEGNTQSTCLGVYADKVGRKIEETYDGGTFRYTVGDDIEGIDMITDDGRAIIILQPSL